jgi:S1-C subfamily serine protease
VERRAPLAISLALLLSIAGCAQPTSNQEASYPDSLYNQPENLQQFIEKVLKVTYQIECGGGTGSGWGVRTVFKVEVQDYIVTNAHVVRKCARFGKRIKVTDHEGKSFETRFIFSHLRREDEELDFAKRDLAVLEPIEEPINTIEALSDHYPVGSWVMTASYPGLGFENEQTITTGKVVAHTRYHGFVVDAAVNRGSSGGLVVNANGEAIGIIHAVGRRPILNNATFILPVSQIEELLTLKRVTLARIKKAVVR